MYRITICDDEPSELSLLKGYVSEWAAKEKNEVGVNTFQNAEQFLFSWEEKKDVDILLLDIEMPGMKGIDLARRLRKAGEQVQIIFVTGVVDYVLDGYDVDAVSYLVKPINQERLFSCLDKAIVRCGQREKELVCEAAGEISKVKVKDIFYLESCGHDTLIYAEKYPAASAENGAGKCDILRSKTGIHTLEKELQELSSSFYKLHRSYLVNLMHIVRITRKEVEMENGQVIPIARGKWEELNRAYLDYYRKHSV